MEAFAEMKSWMEFGADDEDRLRAFAPIAEQALPDLARAFYARILAHPGAASVLKDEGQVERLKITLERWSRELLQGPWDAAYVERRQRIGRRHVEVGLASRYMFTAMHGWRSDLRALARRTLPEDVAEPTCRSIERICDLDLAMMTGTYLERREAAQLQTLQDLLVSHMPVTILVLDASGIVTAATRADVRLFGDVPAIGRPWQQALPRPLLEVADLDRALIRARATGRDITLPRVDATFDGATRSFRFSVVPLDHPHATALVHLEELTDTIRSEARLQRAEALAQLGALSAAVAHELRNPLAGISGALQVIRRSLPETDSRRDIMEKVEQQVRRLDALVTDLLAFARPPEARSVPVALHEAARAVTDMVQREHPGVRIHCTGEGVALADPNLVQQVLFNLVLNAVQAAPADGEVHVLLAPGSLTVCDSGAGVPPEILDRVFQAFYTTKARGTGLGLAICHKLALAMGGAITLENGTGPLPGACFTIRLPVPVPT
jgi:signal transduction histidine kinase